MSDLRPKSGRTLPTRELELRHGHPERAVIGIDEVGLAPHAGPVVACAILMPAGDPIPGVRDSKMLTPARRVVLAQQIRDVALAIGIGAASAREVELINPRAASHRAMARAVAQLSRRRGAAPDFALVDGSSARELRDLIGPHGRPRRSVGLCDRLCLHRREGASRQAHGRTLTALPRIRLGIECGLSSPRTPCSA